MKLCKKCSLSKNDSEFYKDASRKDSLAPYCKECRAEEARARYLANSEKIKKRVRSNRLGRELELDLKRMGMSEGQYNAMLLDQGGVCAICKESESYIQNGKERRLSIDHDHSCCPGRRDVCGHCNRGLLCARCNKALGMVRDDIDLLKAMIEYLKGKND